MTGYQITKEDHETLKNALWALKWADVELDEMRARADAAIAHLRAVLSDDPRDDDGDCRWCGARWWGDIDELHHDGCAYAAARAWLAEFDRD